MTPRAKKTNKSSKPEAKSSEELDAAQGQGNVEEPEKLQDSSSLDSDIEHEDQISELKDQGPFTENVNEALRTETIQPEYHEKPTVPRKAFFTDDLNDDLFKEIDGIYNSMDQSENENEEFAKEVTASLQNDEFIIDEPEETESLSDSNQYKQDLDGSDLVADIEQEIDRAPQAENPFNNSDSENNPNSDFLSQLNEIFTDDYQNPAVTKPLDDFEELTDNDLSLSSESWLEVLEATKDLENELPTSNLFLNSADTRKDVSPFTDDQWRDEELAEVPGEHIETEPDDVGEIEENLVADEEQDESLSTLRQSFIEDFEQTPWPDEEEKKDENNVGWFKKHWFSYKNWVKSLNTAERILLIMSSIISIAVIVAIVLVSVEWRSIVQKESPPPLAIEMSDPNLVYPTGIQLPGGWFFYLSPGEIKNNQWNPQTAEWLQNTTVRRVAAIPWSRQAEAVVQSLSVGDEINLYMNNNDINTYYVEETKLVERDNVKILTDTEPSLAVILFKSDNSDRWVVIAKP